MNVLKIAWNIVLGLFGLASLAALVVAGLSFAGVASPLVMKAGSMEPAISVGSFMLVAPVETTSIEVGDIVTVPQAETGLLVTNRVQEVNLSSSGEAIFVLKGDANELQDDEIYTTASPKSPVIIVPGLGTVVEFFSTNKVALVAIGALVLGAMFIMRRRVGKHRG